MKWIFLIILYIMPFRLHDCHIFIILQIKSIYIYFKVFIFILKFVVAYFINTNHNTIKNQLGVLRGQSIWPR